MFTPALTNRAATANLTTLGKDLRRTQSEHWQHVGGSCAVHSFLMERPAAIAIEQEIEAIYCAYRGLAAGFDSETGLGGRLLFVGEPGDFATRMLRAANIAGAGSVAASSDAVGLRHLMRDGALDFVVTDLDEALRILKNEIRKKLPIAVGINIAPLMVARQMIERGVQPDLLAADSDSVKNPPGAEAKIFLARGARAVATEPMPSGLYFSIRRADAGGQQTVLTLEESLLDRLAPSDHFNRRWVRLSPRYLPVAARRLRSIACASQL